MGLKSEILRTASWGLIGATFFAVYGCGENAPPDRPFFYGTQQAPVPPIQVVSGTLLAPGPTVTMMGTTPLSATVTTTMIGTVPAGQPLGIQPQGSSVAPNAKAARPVYGAPPLLDGSGNP
jgi:hypothetical protein